MVNVVIRRESQGSADQGEGMDFPFRRTSRKLTYPDHVNAYWTELVLGADEHAQWAVLPPGSPVHRASGTVLRYRSPQVFCYPHDQWWVARFGEPDASFRADRKDGSVKRFEHPAPDRVDISTPAAESDDGISFVDLVLDVLRHVDGSVTVQDEDEVDSIPPGYVEAALRSCAEVVALLADRTAPFDGTASRWLHGFTARSGGG